MTGKFMMKNDWKTDHEFFIRRQKRIAIEESYETQEQAKNLVLIIFFVVVVVEGRSL